MTVHELLANFEQNDPYQVQNIFPSSPSSESRESHHKLLGLPLSKVLPRLDALLMVSKSCAGQTCRDPWSVIHPTTNVLTLKDALAPKYDAFYLNKITKQVYFDKCELGYILESEGPQKPSIFEEGVDYES